MGWRLLRAGGALCLCVLGACAEPVELEGDSLGAGGAALGACKPPTCSACGTCMEMCLCSGSPLAKCQSVCATGTGGKTGSGGTGGTGATTSTGGAGGTGATGSTGGSGGTGGTGATGGSAGTCSVSVGDPTCDACVAKSCCTQAEGCANDPSCGALMNCLASAPECQSITSFSELLSCSDKACPAYSAGKPSFSAYVTCMSTQCAGSC